MPAWASADVEILDRIIAVVDDDIVLQSELDQRMRSVKAQLENADRGQVPPDDVLQEQIIDRLIIESLQLQMAERAGVRISDEELNQALRGIAEQNNMTLPQFQQAIEADGISYVEMRDQVRREMAISRVQQGVMRNRIKISEQEIKDFLASEVGQVVTADEYRLAHILLPLPEDPSADDIRSVRSDAEEILQQIENEGADFQSLAVQESAGQNALEGGDLGWRKAVQLPTMFSDVAQQMEIGEVRGPIKSGSGFHRSSCCRNAAPRPRDRSSRLACATSSSNHPKSAPTRNPSNWRKPFARK
ncbi:MAG: peptidylprolyl isomerase [Gammaproteobacteria bacterium]|nr:peptidylprolyl isomerase [Gammaproteobacteria bacterium]